MPVALVTGATGQVGAAVSERLIDDGWTVRALVRRPEQSGWLQDMGVRLVTGDVLDADSFARAAAGTDVVHHAAAVIIESGGWDRYRQVNVDGTRNAIDAARSAGARLMHVSSVAVYGDARFRDGGKTHEAVPLPPLPENSYYARSKRESEALVLSAHASGSIWATAIRPDVIYGRRDRQFVPRVARIANSGFMPAIRGGRAVLAIVHAANVADAAVRAAGLDVAGGKAYNVANDFDVTYAEFVRLGGVGLGRKIRLVPIPLAVARAGVAAARAVVAVAGRGQLPAPSGGSLDFVARDNPFTSELARAELGWDPPVHPSTGIPEAFRWWKDHRGSIN
jgi:nucleoside-diphosphate-sugar epimerase